MKTRFFGTRLIAPGAAPTSFLGTTLAIGVGTTMSYSNSLTFGIDGSGNSAVLRGPGTLATSGLTTINDNGGYIELQAGAGVTWNNSGTLSVSGHVRYGLSSGDNFTLNNLAGGVIDLATGDADLLHNAGGSGTLTNAGLLTDISTSGTQQIDTVVNNTGTLAAGLVAGDLGVLELEGGGTIGGSVAGTGTVLLGGGAFTTTGISGGGTLTLDAAVLSAAASVSIAPKLRVFDGTLAAASGADLTLAGSAEFGIDASGNAATVNGPGTVTTAGATIVDGNGGYNELFLAQGITWENTGSVTDDGLIRYNPSSGDTVTIKNDAGATFTLAATTASIEHYSSGTDSFVNAGLLHDSAGSLTETIDMPLSSTGTIEVDAGATLALSGGGSLRGKVTGSGVLQLTNGAQFSTRGIAGGGNLSVVAGAGLNVTASGTISPVLHLDNGTLTAASGVHVTLAAGSEFGIDGSGNAAALTGPGSITTTGAATVDGNGGYNELFLGAGVVWENTGSVTDNGLIRYNPSSGDTVTIRNDAGATFTLAATTAAIEHYYSGTDSFVNAGLLKDSAGSLTETIDMPLASTGTIEVDAGTTLALSGGGTLGGSVTGAGLLELTSNVTFFTGGIAGAGALAVVEGAVLDVTASGALTPTLRLADGTLTTATSVNASLMTGSEFGIDAGGNAAVFNGPGTITTTGAATVDGNGGYNELFLAQGITWENTGSVTDDGLIRYNPSSGDTVTIKNDAGATFTLAATTAGIEHYYGGTDSFVNAGLLEDSAGSLTETIDMPLSSTGTIEVDTGATLALSGGGTLGGSVTGAGVLQLTGGVAFYTSGITGTGALSVAAGGILDVTASGTITPTLRLADGTLTAATGVDATLATGSEFGIDTSGNTAAFGGPGTVTTTGATTVDGNGGYTELFLGNGVVWENTGAVTDNGLIRFNTTPGDTATIRNDAGASFIIATAVAQITQYNTGADSFVNAGLLRDSASSGTENIAMAVTSTGTIEVDTGAILALSGGGAIGGGLTGGGDLALTNAAAFTTAGISGTGSLSITGAATLTGSASGTVTPALLVFGGTLAAAAGVNLTLAGAAEFGVDSGGNGAVVAGAGTVTTVGTTIVDGNGGYQEVLLGHGITWANAGNVTVNGIIAENLVTGDSVNFVNEAGGIFTFSNSDATISNAQAGTDLFSNAGLLQATSGTVTLGLAVSNPGTVLASAANLLLTAGVSNLAGGTLTAGSWEAAATAATAAGLYISGSAVTNDAATIVLTGAGSELYAVSGGSTVTLEASLATIAHSGTLEVLGGRGFTTTLALLDNGLISLGGGTLSSAGLTLGAGATLTGFGTISNAVASAGTITANGGTLILTGAVTGAGVDIVDAKSTLDLRASGVPLGHVSGAGTLQLDGSDSFSGALAVAAVRVSAGGSLAGAGSIKALADNGAVTATGALNITGALTGTGTLTAGGTVTLAGGGNFGGTLTGGTAFEVTRALKFAATAKLVDADITASANLSFAGSVTNTAAGSITLVSAAGQVLTLTEQSGKVFTNAGAITASGAGSVSVAGSVANNGIFTDAAGTLSFLGKVSGTGTLDISAASTLALLRGAAGGEHVSFGGAGELGLTGAASFAAHIDNFATGDVIKLLAAAETSFGYANNVLTVKDGTVTVASLHFDGSYTAGSFTVVNDGSGNVVITHS